MTVRVEGLEQVRANLNRLSREVRTKVQIQATKEAADEVIADLSSHINSGTAAGNLYTHEFRTINGRAVPTKERATPHRASAPGQYPANDKSGLVKGLRTQRRGHGTSVVSSVSYAVPLEFKDPAKGGRPYMGRIIQENENKIRRRVVNSLKSILRRPRA